jgi:hypothetical protein
VKSSGLDRSALQSGAVLEDAERRAGRIFAQNQFKTMAARHAPEEIIKLQVLMDYGQQAAQEAKQGRVAEARRLLAAIDGVPMSADPEFEEARSLTLLPVWALVRWRENDPAEAIELLERALAAGHVLATRFGHAYLTTKLIHLAANVARVLQSAGANERALAVVAELRAVIIGNARSWPYDGADALRLPLEGSEREIIERQLSRTESLAGVSLRKQQTDVAP